MPNKDARVLFSAGLQANYNAIAEKNENTIYFCTDTKRIYVGSAEYTKGGAILTSEPTSTTVGDDGKLYAYNGNLYLCTVSVVDEETVYTYTRVANVNDVVGSVTKVTAGAGLTGGDITSSGTIAHAVPAGAAEAAIAAQTLTPGFGDTVTLDLVSSVDGFGHVTGHSETTIQLPLETAVSVQPETAADVELKYGDSFDAVTAVTLGDRAQSIKRTVTHFTLPASDDTTYTFTTGSDEGKITVTPSVGEAYQVEVKGWSDLAKKGELAAVFKFKGTVADVDSLPKTGDVGDVYHVTEMSSEYVCITASTEGADAVFEELGSEIDLSDYALSADVIQRVTGAGDMIPIFTADGTLTSSGKTTQDFVLKTATIAGIDLQDNITKDELNTALGTSTLIHDTASLGVYRVDVDPEGGETEITIADAIGALENEIGPGGSVVDQIDNAISGLNASISNEAAEGEPQPDVVISISEEGGLLKTVSATVTAERFDAYGAAATAVKGLKDELGTAAYADVSTEGIATGTGLATSAQVKSYVDSAIAWSTF